MIALHSHRRRNARSRVWWPAALAALLLGALLVQSARGGTPVASMAPANAVVAYLDGAERQAESAEQEREIARALHDLRTLPAGELATRRYADYDLSPGRWTLAELVGKYFVPRTRVAIDPAAFYRDARDPRALAVIDAHLAAMREQRQVRRIRQE